MIKKENPLRQLPLNRTECGEIRIHLAQIMQEKNALFGQDVCPISDIEACTRNTKEVIINLGNKGLYSYKIFHQMPLPCHLLLSPIALSPALAGDWHITFHTAHPSRCFHRLREHLLV